MFPFVLCVRHSATEQQLDEFSRFLHTVCLIFYVQSFYLPGINDYHGSISAVSNICTNSINRILERGKKSVKNNFRFSDEASRIFVEKSSEKSGLYEIDLLHILQPTTISEEKLIVVPVLMYIGHHCFALHCTTTCLKKHF